MCIHERHPVAAKRCHPDSSTWQRRYTWSWILNEPVLWLRWHRAQWQEVHPVIKIQNAVFGGKRYYMTFYLFIIFFCFIIIFHSRRIWIYIVRYMRSTRLMIFYLDIGTYIVYYSFLTDFCILYIYTYVFFWYERKIIFFKKRNTLYIDT